MTRQSLYTSHRWDVRWEWRQLDNNDRLVGDLAGVKGGSVEQSVFNTIRGRGNLSWQGSTPLDWTKIRVQPWYFAQTAYGPIELPLGVFICSTPDEDHTSTGITCDVELYDKLLLLDQSKTQQTYTAPAGAVVTNTVRTILAGERVSVVDSAETLTAPQTWPAGTTWLTIVNDLLATINYFSLWVDGYGTFRAEPYVRPAQRGVAYDFEHGETSVFATNFARSRDTFATPNKVILIARADEGAPPLIGVAVNDDPRSPTSTVNRGTVENPVEIAVSEENVEATSQATINELALRRLVELSRKATTFTIRHRVVPLDVNDAVTFQHPRVGGVLAVVQSMTMRSELGALVETRLLEVAV